MSPHDCSPLQSLSECMPKTQLMSHCFLQLNVEKTGVLFFWSQECKVRGHCSTWPSEDKNYGSTQESHHRYGLWLTTRHWMFTGLDLCMKGLTNQWVNATGITYCPFLCFGQLIKCVCSPVHLNLRCPMYIDLHKKVPTSSRVFCFMSEWKKPEKLTARKHC